MRKTFLKTTEAVTNEKEVNTEIVCSHEQEDVLIKLLIILFKHHTLHQI